MRPEEAKQVLMSRRATMLQKAKTQIPSVRTE
jgi:hypothetical protein